MRRSEEDSMRLIDISGVMEEGMWYYEVLYPPVEVRELDPLEWPDGGGKIYGQAITFGSQSGTHVATGAHIYADGRDVASIPIERCVAPAVISEVDVGPSEPITLEQVQGSLKERGIEVTAGDALIVATGWDDHWNTDRYLEESPRLSRELVDWAIDNEMSYIASDIPLFDTYWEEGFWPRLYASETLVLAPLVGIKGLDVTRARLVATPIKIKGSCGSPCRAFLEIDA
jgi:arylformamidase